MRNIISFILVGLLLSVLFFPGEISAQSKDIKGWHKVQWGMTEDVIEEIYGEKIRRLAKTKHFDYQYRNLEIDNFTILGYQFNVLFFMDNNTHRLNRVSLTHSGTDSGVIFLKLEDALKSKYDLPSEKSVENLYGITNTERVWLFPSTKITLTHHKLNIIAKYCVSVRYEERIFSDKL